MHIYARRIGTGEGASRQGEETESERYTSEGSTNIAATPGPRGGEERGRWPANVVLDQVAAAMISYQSGERTDGGSIVDAPSDLAKNTSGEGSDGCPIEDTNKQEDTTEQESGDHQPTDDPEDDTDTGFFSDLVHTVSQEFDAFLGMLGL